MEKLKNQECYDKNGNMLGWFLKLIVFIKYTLFTKTDL